jgi:hypothetical protein
MSLTLHVLNDITRFQHIQTKATFYRLNSKKGGFWLPFGTKSNKTEV